MFKLKIIYTLFLVSGLLVACSPKENPKEIFIRAELEARKLQEAEYTLSRITQSASTKDSFDLKVFVKRNPADTSIQAFVRIEQADSSAIIYNSGDFKLIDFKNKKIIVPDSSSSAAKLMKIMSEYYTCLMSFNSNAEIETLAQSMRYVGSELINGEGCRHLHTTKNKNGMDVNLDYYFSTKDYLIRKFSAKSTVSGQRVNEITYEIKHIKTSLDNSLKLFDYKTVNDIESYKKEIMPK